MATGARLAGLVMAAFPSDLRATLAVTRKELLASLRDRQTAIYTFVLPICMYPIVFWAMVQGALLTQGHREHTDVRVGIAAERPADLPAGVESALTYRPEGAGAIDAEDRGEVHETNVVDTQWLPGPIDAEGARAWLAGGDRSPVPEVTDDEATEAPEKPHTVLWLPTPPPGETAKAQVFYDSTESRSVLAKDRIEERLPAYADGLRDAEARAAGHDPAALAPLEIVSHDIAPQEDRGALMLSMILPMMLVIIAVLGAFFPAIDLTAGEKERGTAETTLILPVPRSAVHQGKILAVCTTSIVATFLNLFALGFSANSLLKKLSGSAPIEIELPLLPLLSILPLAILFAFFLSSVLTGIAGMAATFKEGQALLGPVQMLFMLPAMAGAMPGLQLTPALAFVPIINVVLAFRSMLIGEGLILEYVLTAIALLVYALLAIWLAVRLLSRESVALSGETLPIKRLWRILRSSGGTR